MREVGCKRTRVGGGARARERERLPAQEKVSACNRRSRHSRLRHTDRPSARKWSRPGGGRIGGGGRGKRGGRDGGEENQGGEHDGAIHIRGTGGHMLLMRERRRERTWTVTLTPRQSICSVTLTCTHFHVHSTARTAYTHKHTHARMRACTHT